MIVKILYNNNTQSYFTVACTVPHCSKQEITVLLLFLLHNGRYLHAHLLATFSLQDQCFATNFLCSSRGVSMKILF